MKASTARRLPFPPLKVSFCVKLALILRISGKTSMSYSLGGAAQIFCIYFPDSCNLFEVWPTKVFDRQHNGTPTYKTRWPEDNFRAPRSKWQLQSKIGEGPPRQGSTVVERNTHVEAGRGQG